MKNPNCIGRCHTKAEAASQDRAGVIRLSADRVSIRAFTLIELLVIIGTIAVLAGMLVPARANTKTRSGQAICRNNLRQIGIAFMGYLGDSNDIYPLNSEYDGNFNHGVASLFSPGFPPIPFKASSIHNPSQKIMIVDEKGTSGKPATSETPDDGRWIPSIMSYVGHEITDIHNQKGAVLFTDGHVQLVRPAFGNDADHFDATR